MGQGVFRPDAHVLNPRGQVIRIPAWVAGRLRKLRLLYWDNETKRHRIHGAIWSWMELLDMPDFRPQQIKAYDIEKPRARAKHSGYTSRIMQALGSDCSGLSAPSRFECESIKMQLDHTDDPRGPVSAGKAEQAIEEVRSARSSA